MANRTGPFSLIRELLKYCLYMKSATYNKETGILEFILSGRVVINSQIIEGIKKSGFILESISNSVASEFLDSLGEFLGEVENEDDVPEFICTTIRLKDTLLPPLEHVGKSDISEFAETEVNH